MIIINDKEYKEIISYQYNFSFLPKIKAFFTITFNSDIDLKKQFKNFILYKNKNICIKTEFLNIDLNVKGVFISELENKIIFLLEKGTFLL